MKIISISLHVMCLSVAVISAEEDKVVPQLKEKRKSLHIFLFIDMIQRKKDFFYCTKFFNVAKKKS
jgi:hypothetical protein